MPKTRSVEVRLLQVLAGIAAVAVAGVLAILPYRLYERDIRTATVQAHRIASLINTSIGHALAEGEDPTDLINRFQGIGDLTIRLERAPRDAGDFGVAGARGTSSLDGTDLTYTAPPVLDEEGRPWRAQMYFDLAPMKRESVRLIIDLVLAVVIGSGVFSLVVFLMVRRSLVNPLRDVTQTIERLHPEAGPAELPGYESQEMDDLAQAVVKACRAHHHAGV
jgi:methyl-accepting chemotaxis protein